MPSRRIIKKDIKFFGVTFLSRKVTKQYNSLHSLQRQSELVGARGPLKIAVDAAESVNNLLSRHTFDEACDALRIAAATALKPHIMHAVVFINLKCDCARAGAFGFICVFHIAVPSVSFCDIALYLYTVMPYRSQ